MCTVQTVWAATLWPTLPSLAALPVQLPASTLHEHKAKNSDTAAPKGSAWKKNVIFALVVLALAAGVFLAVRAQHPAKGSGLQAVVDFGDGVTETLTLAQDHDYLYEVGDYVVHLQVKDGAIAFLDSQCPDHVCEQFGWLDKDGAWAACVPAGVYVVVEPTADAGSK